MTKCDRCGKEDYVIYIGDWGHICPECEDLRRRIMARKKRWAYTEEKVLIDKYSITTIKELMAMFPGRDEDSINSKVKRLKAKGKIVGGKTEETKQRSYDQRGDDFLFTVDQK